MPDTPPLKRILVPTDLSELSAHALECADRIAERTEGELHLLKIIEPSGEMLFDPEGELLELEDHDMGQLELERKNDEEAMEKWASRARSQVVRNVVVGRLVDDILRYVREHRIELVVMGTHGSQGGWNWLGASVAEKLVRHSDAPVLSVKGDPGKKAPEHILLASDFEDPQFRGPIGPVEEQVQAAASDYPLKGSAHEPVGIVKRLVDLFDAELHLLRVVKEEEKELEKLWVQAMDRFIEKNGLGAAKKHIEPNEDVEEGVFAFAEREGMELVAIGTHGRSAWSHLFRSSVSEELVDHLPFPVLTYRIGDGS